jgi:hypothetical protein
MRACVWHVLSRIALRKYVSHLYFTALSDLQSELRKPLSKWTSVYGHLLVGNKAKRFVANYVKAGPALPGFTGELTRYALFAIERLILVLIIYDVIS